MKYIIIPSDGDSDSIYQAEKTPEQVREHEFKMANDQGPVEVWNPIQFWDKSVPIV